MRNSNTHAHVGMGIAKFPISSHLATLGSQGVRITLTADGKFTARIPTTLPADDIRLWLRANRDEVLALVTDLDRRVALADRILDGIARKASHHPATLTVVGIYRESIAELRERLDPVAGEVDEAARAFAARVEIPAVRRAV